jgi:hypothetical protein
MYSIARIGSMEDFNRAEQFHILYYLWGSTYRPEVTGRLAYLDGRAFVLQMVCREANPTRVYKNNDELVCKDSCMEAFLDFKPDEPRLGYASFEMNANGTLHSSFGTNRYDRVFLREMDLTVPQPVAQIFPDYWQVDLQIPLVLINRLYGVSDFTKGYAIRGNFFKCGDETPSEHYGTWSMVHSEKPDFHLSQYFGDMVVE